MRGGDPLKKKLDGKAPQVLPACAGVIPSYRKPSGDKVGFTRMRGGDPPTAVGYC